MATLNHTDANTPHRWYFDYWYCSRQWCKVMARRYEAEGNAAQAIVVRHAEQDTFGILYLAIEPVADWHMDAVDEPSTSNTK